MKKTAIVLASAALVAGLACSGAPKNEDTPNAGPQQLDSAQTTAPAKSAPPAGPVTAFADGTYEVGAGAGLVPPGKYKVTVPADSFGCYWARLKGTGGTVDEIITNGNADKGAPVVVTIAATDKAFETKGCGTWKP